MNHTPQKPAPAAPGGTRETARVLSGLREAALSGLRPPPAAHPLIGESWMRVLRLGLDPDRGAPARLLPLDELEHRRRTSPLAAVLPTLREGLVSVADAARHIMVVTDADGRVLWRDGNARVRLEADRIGLEPGSSWAEESVGTNGIGTALVTGRPVRVHSAEHFVRSHHSWTCAAAPLHDPRDGRLLGVVDVSGPAATVHPATARLVASVARLGESELRERHLETIERLRAVAAPLLCRLGGARAVAIDRSGWTAAVTGMPPPGRLALPENFGTGSRRIPALGPCTVEPLPDGWLIRLDEVCPPGPGDAPPVTGVALDLRRPGRPTLTVTGGTGDWTQPLSPRHAEMLYALARRPAGRSAAQLAADLFGDPSRTVTVRAEMSRLRRTLAGVLDHRPYRFADGVDVRLLAPDHPGDLLPRSTAPLVVAARRAEDGPAPSRPPRPGVEPGGPGRPRRVPAGPRAAAC
ncbi:diguanylate cyclase [Streptomyces fradiae]|nr:helix-turn-helix domain-containing protein [Streptomyces fradiae]OFA46536.1 diguanylate cyclase [Streptomyces fradiae]